MLITRLAGPVAAAGVFVALATGWSGNPPAPPAEPVAPPVPAATPRPPAAARLTALVRGDGLPNAPALWRATLPEAADGQAQR